MATIKGKVQAYVGRAVNFGVVPSDNPEVILTDYSDGKGAVITYWNVDGKTQPTQSQLDALDTQGNAYDEADAIEILRRVRNNKLAETDWMANSDVSLSDEWKTYRQQLRDITKSYSSLDKVVWPTKPS